MVAVDPSGRVRGAFAGDLLVATDGGAKAETVRCALSCCTARHVADGPAIAYAEGHIGLVA